jgi:hypothetical protein
MKKIQSPHFTNQEKQMSKFKAGDKIRRITHIDDLEIGGIYTFRKWLGGNMIVIEEFPDDAFDQTHFELVESEVSPSKEEAEIVKAWFDKLKWLDDNTQIATFGGFLSNEIDDTYNLENCVDFVISSYEAYQAKAKQELLDKKAELELQLARINEQLGE